MKKIVFHPLLWLCVAVLAVAVYAGGSRSISEIKYAYFSTSEAGDTAAVMFFELNSATASSADSFAYIDTFVIGPTPDTFVATFVSPSQVMRLTPLIVDSSSVVSCSISFAAQTLGFDVDPDDAYVTVAKICDTLTSLFEATTDLTDSVKAEDSATYVKITSLFSQDVFTARWSFIYAVTGGTGTFDTAMDITTEAEVAAGMAAACNAEDSIAFYATAINSGDTAWIVTSDDPGLEMVVYLGDTATDTTRTQANVTSSSQKTDTLKKYAILIRDDGFRALGINGDIVLDTTSTDSIDGSFGLGLGDSASLWLKSYKDSGGVRVYRDLDSVIGDTIPLTLHIARIPALANDTLFFNGLMLMWYISDTLSDTVVDRAYPIYIDLNLTEM